MCGVSEGLLTLGVQAWAAAVRVAVAVAVVVAMVVARHM
jgi:hypothetical protein